MVSVKDIAKECGVSVATVSKALNGHSDISQATKEKVRATAQRLGYMPNSAARALKTNRTYNLGVLFVDEAQSGLTHEFFAAVLDSFKRSAEGCGYDITFINHNVGGKPTSYLQHCRYRGVDGVVIACVDFLDPLVRELAESDLPLVTLDHVFNNRLAVMSDNVQGVEALVHYAYRMGHRRIAFLHGETTTVTQNRLVGFYRACEELGLEIPEEYVREAAYHDPDRCAATTMELMQLPERPTCILFPDDYSYVGGQNALARMGLQIPEDVSVMGYDGIHLARVLGLTTYRQDTEALGRIAAERLISLIEHPKTTLVDRIMVSGELIPGKTVKRLTK